MRHNSNLRITVNLCDILSELENKEMLEKKQVSKEGARKLGIEAKRVETKLHNIKENCNAEALTMDIIDYLLNRLNRDHVKA